MQDVVDIWIKFTKILIDILDIKAAFPPTNFFIRSNFFHYYSEVIKLKLLCETLKNEK